MTGQRVFRFLMCICALAVGAGAAELKARASEAAVPAAEAGAPATLAAPSKARGAVHSSMRVAPFRVPELPVEPQISSHPGLGERYRDGAIITGSTPHRLILFTFDDGPDRRTTPLLLDRLDDAGVRAVFFLVASRIAGNTPNERQDAAVAREIIKRGHLVGNHTLDHAQLPLLDEQAALHQIVSAEQIFEKVYGVRPWLFRPPFGAHSERIDTLLANRGYTTMLWNLGTGDFQVRSADEVFEIWRKVFERREAETGDRGGIILLHDTYTWSVDAFQRIVSHLRTRNCELLERGEELFEFVDDPSLFFMPRADGDASQEAPAAQLTPEELEARQVPLRETETLRCRLLASGG
jgi:peptidoglycan/xylan/chitin deacetylase (PgdA/CDA1 family)